MDRHHAHDLVFVVVFISFLSVSIVSCTYINKKLAQNEFPRAYIIPSAGGIRGFIFERGDGIWESVQLV